MDLDGQTRQDDTLAIPTQPWQKVPEATVFDPRSDLPGEIAKGPRPATSADLRKRGLASDLAYAVRVMWRAFRGRRELADLRERLYAEKAERTRRLIEVARAAVSDERLETATVAAARGRLSELDAERARRQAAADAAAAEAERAEAERREAAEEAARRTQRLGEELDRLEAELKPLEAEAAQKRKALEELRAALAAVDRRIRALEKRVTAARSRDEGLAIEADLAAARAEREALIRDEPVAAGAVAALEPRIAALRETRDRKKDEIKRARAEAAERDEQLAATVKAALELREEREAAHREAVAARDAELLALGEALDRERPPGIAARLRPADEHAYAIAILERRALEIAEANAAIDRPRFYRGLALLGLGLILVAIVLGLTT